MTEASGTLEVTSGVTSEVAAEVANIAEVAEVVDITEGRVTPWSLNTRWFNKLVDN